MELLNVNNLSIAFDTRDGKKIKRLIISHLMFRKAKRWVLLVNQGLANQSVVMH